MATYNPRLVGSSDPLGSLMTESTGGGSSDKDGKGMGKADESHNGSNYFKSAQWSPDGTTILTSSADNALRSFILYSSQTPDYRARMLMSYPKPDLLTFFEAQDQTRSNLIPPTLSQNPSSLRSLPIRLYSPFAPAKVASYPLVSPTTEAFVAPHSLLFSDEDPNHFFAGSDSSIGLFDLQRDGMGPVSRMHTTTSRRGRLGTGMKGIVSAMGMSFEGVLAAGTFTRSVGLYEEHGSGGTVAIFPIQNLDDHVSEGGGAGQGTGITQLLWSACSRYLCVAERGSDGVGVWDIRGTGRRLAWLRGREALTPQRLGVEVTDGEVWAGGTDGYVRVWEGLGVEEGIVDPMWEFKAHDDAACATTLHSSGSVLATASGQQHFLPRNGYNVHEASDKESEKIEESQDSGLKVWAL